MRVRWVSIDVPNPWTLFVYDQGTSQVVGVVVTAGVRPVTDSVCLLEKCPRRRHSPTGLKKFGLGDYSLPEWQKNRSF